MKEWCGNSKHAARCVVLRPDGEGFPLAQPQPTHGTLGGGSCPGTPEMRRRQEEAMRRLASQVPHTPVSVPRYIWDCLLMELNLSTSVFSKFRFFYSFIHLLQKKSVLLLIIMEYSNWGVFTPQMTQRRNKSKAKDERFYLPTPSSSSVSHVDGEDETLRGSAAQVEAGMLTCLS